METLPPQADAPAEFNNIFGDGADAPADLEGLTAAEREQTASAQGPSPLPASVKRIWIQLEDNNEIPPTGQFIGINGRSYQLRAGEPAQVPQELIEVLQDAVASVPVTDENGNVVSYRDRLRFPFRYVRAPASAAAAVRK